MKRGKKMILLLCALAVMIGGYIGVQRLQRTETVSETAGAFDLTAKTIDDLAGLCWTKDGAAYSFVYANDTWTTTDQPAWPVQQSAVQALAEKLVGLQATRKLTDVKSLADYGLEAPRFSVTATWKDGTATTYGMGDATPFADGYYLSLSGQDGTIYTVASSLTDMFGKTQKDMAAMEEIPAVSEATRLSVGSALDVSKKEASTTVDPDQLWYDTLTDVPLDGSAVETLISAAKGLAWDTLVTAGADAESLSEWELDDGHAVSVALSGGEESMTILLGAQNEDGDYYARLPGSAMVYTVDDGDAGSLLTASAENMRVKTLLPMPYEQLASAVFTTGKGTYRIEKPTAESAEDAESDEAEKDLWKQVTALKTIGSPEKERTGDQVLSIRAVSASGMETAVVFSEYSADSYQAAVDGGTPLLVPADEIDALARAIRVLQ